MPPVSPTQSMEPFITPTTHFPKPESKIEKPKPNAKVNSEPQKTAPLLSLSSDLLLKIADHFLDDFLAWKLGFPNSYHGDPDDLDPFRTDNTHEMLEYINLARTHPLLWNLLKGRKISAAMLKEARAKVQARRKNWRQRPYRVSKCNRATIRAKPKKAKEDDARFGWNNARPDFMLYSTSPRFGPFG